MKTRSTRREWTAEEQAYLSAHYANTPTKIIANHLGRSVRSVYRRADYMGLHKSPQFFQSAASGRLAAGHQVNTAGRFTRGLVPWNKGTKGTTGLHKNCRATQFKPGRPPQEARNYKPIGSHRINVDGILERKVTDDTSICPARRWVPVQRLVWEAAHGPIPKGFNVIFRPGQKTTVLEEITLDRLECISRRENMQRNSSHTRMDPEMARLYQLKGAITRQVNRINQQQQEATAP